MIPQYRWSFCFVVMMFLVIIPLTVFSSTIQYTYDSLNRITKVDYGDGYTEQYAYDTAGNRLTKSNIPYQRNYLATSQHATVF
ncbi:MAG: RHS repeat protein [Proteobacteria bacterium]|nr:RHS repeat protein [Pseudomonadota bacterium]